MNLKAAANRLGVHDQTAYKWVRSGELIAVRVGSRYEVSEAAIERLHATRRNVARDLTARPDDDTPRIASDVRDELREFARLPLLDLEPAVIHAARRVAETSGDLSLMFIANLLRTGPEVVTYFDPVPNRVSLLGTLAATRARAWPDTDGPLIRTFLTGERLLVPHVAQDWLRHQVPRDLHQYLDEIGLSSLVAAPIRDDRLPVGSAALLRDHPGRPFGPADEQRVGDIGRLVGTIVARARASALARRTRVIVAERLAAQPRGATPPSPAELHSLLATESMPIAVLDPEARLLGATAAFTALTGVAEAIPGESPLASMARRDLDFVDTVVRVAGPETPYGVVLHCAAVRDPDATLRAVVAAGRPLIEPDREPDPERGAA